MKKIVLFAVVGLLLFGHVSVFAENFYTSDLEGTWYLFDTTVDPAAVPPVPPVYWTYGEFESDASGNVVSGAYHDPLGNTYTVIGGQMMLDKKGVMSGTASVDMGRGITATAMFPHGKIDQAKTNGAYVSLMTVDGSTNPPSMGAGSFIKGGGTFTQADLEGEWHGQGTMIHLTQGAVPVSGIFNIDQDGNVTSGSYTAPNGFTSTVVPAGSKLVVDGDGLVSGTVNLLIQPGAISVVSLIAQAKMDQKKRSATFVTWDVTDPNDPINTLLSLTSVNLVKGGGSFAGTELSGAWYTYSLAMDYSDSDPNNWLIYWVRGQYQTDSSGNISNGYYVGPDGNPINATGGTMSLDNAGEITGNLTIEGGEALTVNGKLDQGKTYGIFGSVDDIGWMSGMTTGVMIKDTYRPAFLPAIIHLLNQE